MYRLSHICTSQRNIFPEQQCSCALISIYTSADKSHGLIFRSAQTYHWSNHSRAARETLGPLTAQDSFHALLPDTKLCLFVPLRVWLRSPLESRPLHGCHGYKGRSEIRILKQELVVLVLKGKHCLPTQGMVSFLLSVVHTMPRNPQDFHPLYGFSYPALESVSSINKVCNYCSQFNFPLAAPLLPVPFASNPQCLGRLKHPQGCAILELAHLASPAVPQHRSCPSVRDHECHLKCYCNIQVTRSFSTKFNYTFL